MAITTPTFAHVRDLVLVASLASLLWVTGALVAEFPPSRVEEPVAAPAQPDGAASAAVVRVSIGDTWCRCASVATPGSTNKVERRLSRPPHVPGDGASLMDRPRIDPFDRRAYLLETSANLHRRGLQSTYARPTATAAAHP